MDAKQTIMIVDDEHDVLNSLKRVFRKPPYEVHVFDSARSALDSMGTVNPDLIISDMRMPEMDGAEFLSQARVVRPMAPRILLTGQADKKDTIRAINEGDIFGFVNKPWDNEALISLVDEGLAKRKQEKLKNRALHTLKKMHDDAAQGRTDVELRLAEESKAREENSQALDDAYVLMEESFLNLLDMKQPGQRALAHHLEEVVDKLSRRLGVSERDCDLFHRASRLHGVGKIGISDIILSKPYAKMSDEEKEIYQAYPTSSACTLIAIEAFAECSDLLFKQKEHIDGSGFPNGLKKQDLSKLNNIFNVALEYSELRYTPGVGVLSHDQAISKMKAQSAAYDAVVFKALINVSLDRDLYDKNSKAIEVAVHALEPGMIVCDDIYNDNNMLLLRGGAPVTEGLITKLANLQKQIGEPISVSVFTKPE